METMSKLINIVRMMNLRCEDVSLLVSRSMDARLSFWERLACRSHLLYCSACRRYRTHLQALRKLAGKVADESGALSIPSREGLTPEARERIRQALRGR
jgi:predicted anti-sigma-YlaC factor YlaD